MLAWAPATLLDALLGAASEGRMRILQASGSLWQGRGIFASLTPDGGSAQPWLDGAWRAEWDELATGRIGWRLEQADRVVLRLRLGAGGVELVEARLDLPLKSVLAAAPHPLARAGWRGAMRLDSPGMECDWQGQCRGSARALWTDAGLDIVPGQRFGDYELLASAHGRQGTLRLRTLGGALGLDGEGGWREDGRIHFEGLVRGDPEIVGRLPNVLDGVAFGTADPGLTRIVLR